MLALLKIKAAMLYIFAAGPDWVKMGYTGQSSAWYRVAKGFWTNDHPEQLCGQLGAEDLELLSVFGGDRKVEAALKSITPQTTASSRGGAWKSWWG